MRTDEGNAAQASHGAARSRGMVRGLLSLTAFLVATLAIVWAIGGQWREVLERVDDLDPLMAFAAAIAGTAMICCSGMTLAVLVKPTSRRFGGLWAVAKIYLIAQLLKYLPGRIWAVLYQVDKLRQMTGGRMAVAASLTHMFLSVFGSVVLFGAATRPGPIIWPFAIAAVCFWLWRGGAARYFGIAGNEWASGSLLCRLAVLTLAEWLTFLVAMWLVCWSIGATHEFSLPLVAFYVVAWIAGSLSVLTPGGLVVREGGFVLLCQLNGVAPEFSLALALLARVIFTAGEFMAAAVGWLVPVGRTGLPGAQDSGS
jgi:glycosyltransferase 2 family protein